MKRGDCWYCGCDMRSTGNAPNRATTDHQLPRSRGGFSATDNMVKCCKLCNNDKGHLTLEEYRLVLALRRGFLKHSGALAAANGLRFWGEKGGAN